MHNFYKNKKILVTGGSGFIGINLILQLQKLEAKVLGTYYNHLVMSPTSNTNNYDYLANDLAFADLTIKSNCENILNKFKFDYIFNCAAVTHGAKFIKEYPEELVVDNTIMNMNIIDAAYKAKIKKFVFISSGTVYPQNIGKEIIFKEKDMYPDHAENNDPPDCYFGVAHMKRYGEKLCEFYSKYVKNPMACIVIRPSNIYGQYDCFDPEISHVMAATVKKVMDGKNPIEVWGDGKDERDFLYIDDFINGMLLAVKKTDSFDCFNLAYGKTYNIAKILKIMEEIAKREFNIKYLSNKPSMIKSRKFNIKKAEKVLGWYPKIDINKGIKKTMEWYQKND